MNVRPRPMEGCRPAPESAPRAKPLARPEVLVERLRGSGVLALAIRCAASHHVGLEHLLGADRKPGAAAARRQFWAVVRWSTVLSSAEIGRLTGHDHTTVLVGIDKYETELTARYAAEGDSR